MLPLTLSQLKRAQSTVQHLIDTSTNSYYTKQYNDVMEMLVDYYKVDKALNSKIIKLTKKLRTMERRVLELGSMKSPFFDLHEILGIEDYSKTHVNDSCVVAGHTKLLFKADPKVDKAAELEILLTHTHNNVGYGVVLSGKNVDELIGQLVKFNLDATSVIESRITKLINKVKSLTFKKVKL